MVLLINKAKGFIRNNPITSIMISILILVIITVIVMRYKNRKEAISRLTAEKPDVMSLSFLGQSKMPRGIRNNNPGNIRKTSIAWLGKLTPGADTGFEQYQSFVYGLRAQIMDLRGDIKKDGDNTLRKLIYKYAPLSDGNNTESYLQNTCNRTGLGPDQLLYGTQEEIRKIVKSQAISENGNPSKYGMAEWIEDRVYDAAWDLSLV